MEIKYIFIFSVSKIYSMILKHQIYMFFDNLLL